MTTKETVASFYPDFDIYEFNTNEPDEVGPLPRGAAHRFRRLSPFTAPQQVLVSVVGTDAIVFRFTYGNEEPSEEGLRPITPSDNLAVELGRYSKKILAVFVLTGAREVVKRGEVLFPPTCSALWADEVNTLSRFACLRNGEVVSSILRTIPHPVRQELATALSKAAASKPVSIVHER